MNIRTIMTLAWVSGALVGVAGTLLGSKRYFDNRLDLEIEDVKRAYAKSYERYVWDMVLNDKPQEPKESEDPPEDIQEALFNESGLDRSSSVPIKINKQLVDYGARSLKSNRSKDNTMKVDPRTMLVSEEEYSANDEQFECKTLVYYAESLELVDPECDEAVDDPIFFAGREALDLLVSDDSPNVVYVRNVRVDTYYEIIVDEGSWTDNEE